jgi:uncharacterized protein (TIGR03790 family)
MEVYVHHHRRSGRRRRGRSRWKIAFAAVFLMVMLGVCRCLPQGFLLNNNSSVSGGGFNPVAATLVLYNENDPLSRDLADFYAKQRGIDPERVVGLKCPVEEEISRQEYDDAIANPLRALFDARRWWVRGPDRPGAEPSSMISSNRIRFVALMRGIPLKIRPTQNYPGDFCRQPSPIKEQNAASVDSELAVLGGFTRSISGIVPNPYYRSYSRISDTNLPGLMLVCRLDAPTGSTVRRMIADSISAERTGLWGRCYIDARGLPAGSGPLAEGDGWMRRIAAPEGGAPLRLPTILDDQPALFSAAYPMGETALYFGWYTDVMTGPFTREDFRFQPGAVACHIHSYSAATLRDAVRQWTGPLLEKGAAAALGNVYEPYLGFTTHLDLFADRLFSGFTLAESAYAATPGVSWMNIVVGDPLYRPGRAWEDISFEPDAASPPIASEGRAYWEGAQTWRSRGAEEGAQALEKGGQRLQRGRIFEGLGLLQTAANAPDRARKAFDQAIRFYKQPADILRVVLHEARLLMKSGQQEKALDLLRANRRKYVSCPAATALDELEAEIAPKLPLPPPPPIDAGGTKPPEY